MPAVRVSLTYSPIVVTSSHLLSCSVKLGVLPDCLPRDRSAYLAYLSQVQRIHHASEAQDHWYQSGAVLPLVENFRLYEKGGPHRACL